MPHAAWPDAETRARLFLRGAPRVQLVTRAVVLLAAVAATLPVTAAGSSSGTRDLEAWAFPRKRPAGVSTRGFDGPPVRRLRAGVYRVHVKATADMPFHLYGPGVNRRTPTRSGPGPFTIYTTWTVRFMKGRYRYAAEGIHATELRIAGLRVNGAFLVV